MTYPHCDYRILHAPGVCEYCDRHPDWQTQRIADKILFTGEEPRHGWTPCPADVARPPGSSSDHRRWGGNKPTTAYGDPSWPVETNSSRLFYGDRGGRKTWRQTMIDGLIDVLRDLRQ